MLLTSCSAVRNDITSPIPGPIPPQRATDSHVLWGLYQFTADPVSKTLEVAPIRTAEFHLNALPFLEPPSNSNLAIQNLHFNPPDIEVDVVIKHPFFGIEKYTGFDVSGILIANASKSGFTDGGITLAGPGDTRLLNADGHSRWWNPSEFPVNPGSIFGYTDGLLGVKFDDAGYNATLNGYKYFCDGLEPNAPLSAVNLHDRGMFRAGAPNSRHYSIKLGDEGLVFNYAVDACWKKPNGQPPFILPDAFPAEANRVEPWFIDVTEKSNSLYYKDGAGGGQLLLSIDVYDWFNVEQDLLYIEAPDGVVPQIGPVSPSGGGDRYSTYEVDIINHNLQTAGNLDLLVTVASEADNFEGFIPGVKTSAYLIHTTVVGEGNPYIPLPIEPNFSVVGNNVSGFAGVYFFDSHDGVSVDVMRFPLDYSGQPTLYMTLEGNFGYPLCDTEDMGAIEVTPVGGVVYNSRSTDIFFGQYPYEACLIWNAPNKSPFSNALTLGAAHGVSHNRDVETDLEYPGAVWSFYGVSEIYQDTVEIPMSVISPPYGTGDYGWDSAWVPVDTVGSVDGKVSDMETYRLAVDSQPQGITKPLIFYFLEGAPDEPGIEVFASETTPGVVEYLTTIDGDAFLGTPIDISVFPAYGKIDGAEGNWLAVLEALEPEMWTVALFEQDGTLVHRYLPGFPGKALALDCDSYNLTIHVWAKINETTKFYVLKHDW